MVKPGKIVLSSSSTRRWITLAHLAVRLLLLSILFFQVNYLSCRNYQVLDLSREGKFTLSDRTARFLEQLDTDLRIVSAFLGTSDVLPEVGAILREYDRIGGARVATEALDLSRSRNRIAELRDRHGISFNRDQVIVISAAGRIKSIASEEMVRRDPATGRIVQFVGEERLTSAILEVTEQRQKRIYLVTGGRRADELVPIAGQLESLVRAQNARLDSLVLSGSQAIPNDADALVFAGHTTDVSKREAEMIRDFWEERRGGLLLLLDPAAETPNLIALLRENGVFPNRDRVLSVRSIPGLGYQKVYNVPVTLLPGEGPTRDLGILGLQLLDRTQSLEVLGGDDLLLSQNIRPLPLMVADPSFWGETEFEAAEVSFNPDLDQGRPDPVITAAAIEKGTPGESDPQAGLSRLVAAGNPNLISPEGNTQKTAADFCMASLNWVMSRETLLGISPRQPTAYSLVVSPGTFGLLQTVIVWVFPSLLLFCGALIWYRRRA